MVDELEILGQSWIRFDPGDFPSTVKLVGHLCDFDSSCQSTLRDDKCINLEDIGSIWYRRPNPIHADIHLPLIQQTFIEREARAALWGQLRTIDGKWVNHPDAIRAASYKVQQLSLASKLGLHIPKTLITNSSDDFLCFYEECHGQVIYKLLGFPLYEVEEGAVASTFTSLVTPDMLKETHRIKATAHLFQEFQPKICDIRVIIIGEQIFAISIYPLSEETRIDFRRDYRALYYAIHRLPDSIQQPLLELVHQYNLLYAAIDLLYTLEHEYIFLELNPVGQLGWLEKPTSLPLFQTLAQLLAMSS